MITDIKLPDALERAYTVLQERCAKAEKDRDEWVEISRRFSEALVDATKERDDLRAEVARLKEQLADGCDGKCAAGECVCETVRVQRPEHERLKRIEAAAKAWRSCEHLFLASDVAGYIECGSGPDGEVKP